MPKAGQPPTGPRAEPPQAERAQPQQAQPEHAQPEQAEVLATGRHDGRQPARRAADPEAAQLIAAQVRGYAQEHRGQPITVLEAGCSPDGDDLGLRDICTGNFGTRLTAVDDDIPLTQAAAAARTDPDPVTLGDLRTIPLLPRSFDIVQCDRLLERIPHAELVLDRLVTGLKPGGLLVLRMTDRDCAAGFIDRTLPGAVRMLLWRWLEPGRPGPFPAVYDRVVSARGIQLFALMRGLAIAVHRGLTVNSTSPDRRRRRFAGLCRLVARLSRGRITAGHDELLMVIRKPEDRTARLL